MFYTKCERVTPQLKKLAILLVRRWMRPILKRSSNYKDKVLQTKSVHEQGYRRPLPNSVLETTEFDAVNRARIPTKVAAAFDVVPVTVLILYLTLIECL